MGGMTFGLVRIKIRLIEDMKWPSDWLTIFGVQLFYVKRISNDLASDKAR